MCDYAEFTIEGPLGDKYPVLVNADKVHYFRPHTGGGGTMIVFHEHSRPLNVLESYQEVRLKLIRELLTAAL